MKGNLITVAVDEQTKLILEFLKEKDINLSAFVRKAIKMKAEELGYKAEVSQV